MADKDNDFGGNTAMMDQLIVIFKSAIQQGMKASLTFETKNRKTFTTFRCCEIGKAEIQPGPAPVPQKKRSKKSQERSQQRLQLYQAKKEKEKQQLQTGDKSVTVPLPPATPADLSTGQPVQQLSELNNISILETREEETTQKPPLKLTQRKESNTETWSPLPQVDGAHLSVPEDLPLSNTIKCDQFSKEVKNYKILNNHIQREHNCLHIGCDLCGH